ncbi:MAG: Sapep family Mn(2+)-dependent dipeptidase, partial [Firmicutes bacterium]|nr:Sapep family Mn(2+)-dependent dipeptidase [Bacillota bacterium]
MQSKKLWQEKLESYREEMVQSLSELIAIPSVAVGRKGDAPFGTEVQRAFDYMLDLAEKNEMDTVNVDNYGGHLEFGGWVYDEEGDAVDRNHEAVGIVSHLDVVPVEEKDWDTPPFEATVKDGRIYGRGSSDDKGPTMAAFYAMKALKDAGYRPKKRVRMILGLDEETNWIGMKKYLEKVTPPEMSMVPDSNFPVTYAEKGVLVFELAAKFGKGLPKGGTTLRSISGGTVHNAVPASASALVRADSYDLIKAKAAAFRERTGYSIRCIGRGKSLELLASGTAAHAARPHLGLNAISVLMLFLSEITDFNNEDVKDFIRFYNDHIGMEYDGTSMNCACTDNIVGPLTFNVGIIKADEKAAQLTINVRTPLDCDDERFYTAIMPIVDKWNLGVVKIEFKKAHHVPKDSHLVTTLMDVYRE